MAIYFPNNFLGQNLLWRDLGWLTNQQTCVLESAGPKIFVLVKVGPITIGQVIRYIGSQKHSIKQICFFLAQQKEDQIWLWVLRWSLDPLKRRTGPIPSFSAELEWTLLILVLFEYLSNDKDDELDPLLPPPPCWLWHKWKSTTLSLFLVCVCLLSSHYNKIWPFLWQ